MGVCMPANARNPLCCKDVLGSIVARGQGSGERVKPPGSPLLQSSLRWALSCRVARKRNGRSSISSAQAGYFLAFLVRCIGSEGNDMGSSANPSNGMIAVDKIGTKVLFLNPVSFATEVVLDRFTRTVHELLVLPETWLAYVQILGDGIHAGNPT